MAQLPEGLRGTLLVGPPNTPARRKKWLAVRRNVLGASEVSTILGLAPQSWEVSPLKVWLEKTDPEYEQDEPTEHMLWGLRLERPVAEEFQVRHARQLGVHVAPSPGLLAHEEHPWLACTPDRLLVDRATRSVLRGALEIKAPGHTLRREWRDGVPYHYQIQTQVQMGIMGLEEIYVVPLFGGNHMPEPQVVKFDPEAFGLIVDICGRWWEEHVVRRVPPLPQRGDEPVLPEVWPGTAGEEAVIRDSLAARARLRTRLVRRRDALDDAIARIDLDLKVAMKDALVAYDEYGNRLARWTRYERSGFDRKTFAREHPALAARYSTKSTSQRFTVDRVDTEEEH